MSKICYIYVNMHDLASRFFPNLFFDSNEPFVPLKIGFSVYTKKLPSDNYLSPTFPRPLFFIKELLETEKDADTIIEYSLWYEADISHLYELEHLWVYINENSVIKVEGSRHGLIVNLEPSKPIFVESGKHGHFQKHLTERIKTYLVYYFANPGSDGLSIKNILAPELQELKHELSLKYDNAITTEKISNYLLKFKSIPLFDFSKKFVIEDNHLIPWEDFKVYVTNYLLDKLSSL